ncbi:chondroitinase-B domain-containing protein [Echinimonas agarilytica]|uniref:Parallel beta-helix repeat (Two copies) n=1 Tax=Echinimonas agarilytica TaxID=1215918 RepID=A0AA41W7P9_9GAMM|nr:chondroitinase-B domain-containing protein [Echinimonas agarilytica]MCM2680420.1 hypothetical protein [Echinimonas agarilytica]
MNAKVFALSAVALALSGCGGSNSTANSSGAVALTGDTVVGQTLTATVSDGNGTSGSSFAYEWTASGEWLSTVTGSTYVLTTEEIGKDISVRVRYTDDDGYSENVTATSAEVTDIVPDNVEGTVDISGVLESGEQLTANVTDANGTSGSAIAYQWMADDVAIADATSMTFLLTDTQIGALVTVSAAYVDNNEYDESVISAATVAVAPAPIVPPDVDDPGSVSIDKTSNIVMGDVLTALVLDGNGTTAGINYQWKADDVDISGATGMTYTAAASDLGKVLSVNAIYIDDDGYADDVNAAVEERVYSVIATDEASLELALAGAVDGDWIALGNGTFAGMTEKTLSVAATLTQTELSTATISGETCIVINGDGAVVDGLHFSETNFISGGTCDSNGNTTLFVEADNAVVRNTTFSGDIATTEYVFLGMKGNDNLVERNLFEGRNVSLKNGALSVYSNETVGEQERLTVQYNLFKDMEQEDSSSDSSASVINLGRSTGLDSIGQAGHKVQYNRFDNINVAKRMMRVQTSNALIHANTIVNSTGMIAVEDGSGNVVTNNVIIPLGTEDKEGGIFFTPMGHTISNNYIENVSEDDGAYGALVMNSDSIDLSTSKGNGFIIDAGVEDLTVTIEGNTIVNAKHGLNFDDKDCMNLDPLVLVSNNLIANEAANANGAESEAAPFKDFVAEPCSLKSGSDYSNNHFYADELSDSTDFDFNGKGQTDGNIGADDMLDMADIVRDAAGLASGQGADAGIGADTSSLMLITEEQVGPGSTWTAN